MPTKTFAAASLVDADGIKESVATAATISTYTGVALDGDLAESGPTHGLAYFPTFTSSANAGSYVAGSTIVFHGSYRGRTVQRTAVVVGTDGGQSGVRADGPLEGPPTSIVVAAQVNTGGAFEFGVTDALPNSRSASAPAAFMNTEDEALLKSWRKVVGGGTGNIAAGYGQFGLASEDVVPVVPGQEIAGAGVSRIIATTTTVPVTVYFD